MRGRESTIGGSISREDLAELPIRRFDGNVRMVVAPEDVADALADIRSESVVGLDTETRPSFRKGESYPPCLVQAATARAVYLFRLPHGNAFEALTEMLQAAQIVKAGVAVLEDLRSLGRVFPFAAKNVVDLGVVARRAGIEQSGLRNLAGLVLGFRVPKGNRTSNWAARQLSPAQITYAATDAWVCRELFLRFESAGLLHPATADQGEDDGTACRLRRGGG
jgi:ribonuclease D